MTWAPYDPCPCGCGVIGWKLSVKTGHVVKDCKCRPCIGGRAKRSGQRHQSRALKDAARAEGTTMAIAPTHEEQARLLVHYESKSGEQIPKGLRGATVERWVKDARNFAHGQVPRKKWAIVFSLPGGGRRILMDFDEWLELVSEIQELP